MGNVIKNPIIPGFYPDPSICRVGDDFYIVCSSFEAYPGLPVFHSKDLANWEQICYAMTMENGFHVDTNSWAGGVMAPTIRYNKGTYYIMNCNFADRGNFMITAKDPAGPWSDPVWLDDIPGIDASFFFDNDGKCYVMGTGDVVERADGSHDRGIWAAEYDIENFKLIGEPKGIWDCALRVATSPEAPHMYHIGDYYYLLIAEGGTEHYHSVAIARSKDIMGWYEGNPANPIMTHRHFGFRGPIANVGHADFVETPDGNWYAVMLGSRTIEGYYKNFGRETFICPMIWERGWPILSPESGKIEFEYPADERLPWTPVEKEKSFDDFDSEKLDLYWTFWGTPYREFLRIADSKAYLKCLKHKAAEKVRAFGYPKVTDNNMSLMGRRQRTFNFNVETKMAFTPENAEEAGLLIMQANTHQYQFKLCLEDGKQVLKLVFVNSSFEGLPWIPELFKCNMHEQEVFRVPYAGSEVVLRLEVRGQDYAFCYGSDADHLTEIKPHGDGRLINPEEVGPMVGTLFSIYASGNGTDSDNEAAFDYFKFEEV